MFFKPLQFDCNPTSKAYNNITSSDNIHKCYYIAPEQFRVDHTVSSSKNKFLNVNIRSLSEKLDSLSQRMYQILRL